MSTRADAPTPGHTIGPFFHFALPYERDRELVPQGSPGSVLLRGTVYDGEGVGLQDGLVELRQADAHGVIPEMEGSLRRDPGDFTGWGRSTTDRLGRFWFSTVQPGPTRPDGVAFFAVTVFARGLMDRIFTRAYVPGDERALRDDPLLASLGDDDRSRLVAVREDGPTPALRFDIHLQGPHETPFLTFPGHADR